jgi:hypothetical protein
MKMKIDRNNYEAYFIDYLDGILSLEEIDLLLDFLNENPDLKEELKGLERIKIEESKEYVPAFNHLKKTDFDHPEIFEETCIRAIENELNRQELELFQLHLAQNPEHKKEFDLFRATISEPDALIIFESKQQLKKKGKVIVPYFWYAAAAAVLLGIFLFLPGKKQPVETTGLQISEVITPVVPKKIETPKEVLSVKTVERIKPINQIVIHQEQVISTQTLRITETVEPLTPLMANVAPLVSSYSEMALVPIDVRLSIRPNNYSKYLTIGEYLTEVKQEKKGVLGKFALNTLKKLSGNKFDYSTTRGGKVEKLEFNTKLLAFTIPVNSGE